MKNIPNGRKAHVNINYTRIELVQHKKFIAIPNPERITNSLNEVVCVNARAL